MKLAIAVLTLMVVLGSVTPTSVVAEELTLDDCIELALRTRYSIIAARGAEDIAKASQRAALGAFLPRVSASYSYSKSLTRDATTTQDVDYDSLVRADTVGFIDIISGDTVYSAIPVEYQPVHIDSKEFDLLDQDGTGKTLSLDASLSVLDLSNYYNYAAAKADRARARLDVIGSEQDLIYSVKASYYALLAAAENAEVQVEAVKRSQEQLKLIQSRFDLGSASLSDVLKQRVQFGNDKLALLSAENLTVTSRANLAYTIGLDPASDVQFSTEYRTREFDGTLDEALAFGLEHQPRLLSAEKSADAARHSLHSSRTEYLPKLSAFAGLSKYSGTQGDTALYESSRRSTSYGFRISWNIFDGFFRERNITSAAVAHNNARALLADTRNMVSRDIKTKYLDIQRLKEQRSVSMENVEAANEDLKITQEKYRLGAATILDLLDAQVSLKRAQVGLLSADFDLNLAVAGLENALGKM